MRYRPVPGSNVAGVILLASRPLTVAPTVTALVIAAPSYFNVTALAAVESATLLAESVVCVVSLIVNVTGDEYVPMIVFPLASFASITTGSAAAAPMAAADGIEIATDAIVPLSVVGAVVVVPAVADTETDPAPSTVPVALG